MPSSFLAFYCHIIFGTKGRAPLIWDEIAPRLHEYIGGIVNGQGNQSIIVGGVADHVHMLSALGRQLSVARAMREVKGNSSRWLHETFPHLQSFAWQVGYGGYSLHQDGVERVRAYISGQEEHHKTVAFRDEYEQFLKRFGFDFDPQYLWR